MAAMALNQGEASAAPSGAGKGDRAIYKHLAAPAHKCLVWRHRSGLITRSRSRNRARWEGLKGLGGMLPVLSFPCGDPDRNDFGQSGQTEPGVAERRFPARGRGRSCFARIRQHALRRGHRVAENFTISIALARPIPIPFSNLENNLFRDRPGAVAEN
jgi:hypothetical protein